jgi:hypothetical protein
MTDELIGGMIRQAIIELESHHGARKAYPVTSKLLATSQLKSENKNPETGFNLPTSKHSPYLRRG